MAKRWKPPTERAVKGRIRSEWEKMAESPLIRSQSPSGQKVLRAVFYAGAQVVAQALAECHAMSDKQADLMMMGIFDELRGFAQDLRQKAGN